MVYRKHLQTYGFHTHRELPSRSPRSCTRFSTRSLLSALPSLVESVQLVEGSRDCRSSLKGHMEEYRMIHTLLFPHRKDPTVQLHKFLVWQIASGGTVSTVGTVRTLGTLERHLFVQQALHRITVQLKLLMGTK